MNLPALLVPEVEAHFESYVGPGPDALVLPDPKGAALCSAHWNPKWRAAVEAVGTLPDGFRFHDLRWAGNNPPKAAHAV